MTAINSDVREIREVAVAPDDGSGETTQLPDEARNITALLAETVSLQDRLLRAVAETENTRRRGERAVEEAKRYAVSNFAREMLAVANNLDRAIKAVKQLHLDPARSGSLIDGLIANQRSMTKSLDKFGIRKMESSGAAFDPQMHEAVMEIKGTAHADGQILQVVEDGYTIQDRLLVPARVVVAGSGSLAQPAGNQF